MSEDDFDFALRRSERQIQEVREAQENRIREQKLRERAELLGAAITAQVPGISTVQIDGMSVKLHNAKGYTLTINLLGDNQYSVHASGSGVLYKGSKEKMMDLVDLWAEDKFPKDEDAEAITN